MKNGTDSLEEEELQTKDFADKAVAPENNKTYKSDVYSLGYIIHFILYGKSPKNDDDEMVINEGFVFKSSLNHDPAKRPNIFEMMDIFYSNFLSKIIFEYKKHYLLSLSIQKDPQAQFNLGLIYQEGRNVKRDIDKAIHHYSLAANQNYPQAQFNLGLIYSEGRYVTRDINKAIHHYSLAANQNYKKAQCNLGRIYYNGQYVTRDINKAIHYYSLAAKQNDPYAQFALGLIYIGNIIDQNIKKSTYYIILASKNKLKLANFMHAVLLHEGIYIKKDIQQAIHY
ncbi:hypothetical protein M9Y10_028742 [Tritrichomonas musculus]|uniref:Protein kinase domain-containing protein n=1 Tax=Tritrichomonas musculus TaxID=1915356 RepID=A0ABR2KNI9_9EUKA